MSTGAKESNQSRSDQSGGGQNVGHPVTYATYPVPNFFGRSGQPDNQDTNRKHGK